MKKVLFFPFTLLSFLFGKVLWTAPPWLQRISTLIRTNLNVSLALLALICVGGAGYLYLDSLPKPVMVKAEFNTLEITPNFDNAKPSHIDIRFEYDFSALKKNQIRPKGVPSVARIDLVGKEISSGIKISPVKKGTWHWTTDRDISFVPETDWPAGTDYKITFSPTIFAEEVVHSQESYDIRSAEMSAKFTKIELYQDPKNISIRRVVATLNFSHPIDKAQLENKLNMTMIVSDRNVYQSPKMQQAFSLTYGKNDRIAYLQSDPISLPQQSSYMTVTLSKGLQTIIGGEGIAKDVQTKVLVPDIYSFLTAKSSAQIVRNEKNEPEQIIMLSFTDDINEQELLSKLRVYILPMKGESSGKGYWRSPREVKTSVLADSTLVDYTLIPSENDYSKQYNVKVDVPENSYLYLKIDKGLTSVNKFVHASLYDDVIRSPAYPKEVDIAGEGSVLTYSGNHELSITTRGVSGLKYKIGRLLEGQLYHLISQTKGDITNPAFKSWNFTEQSIADFETTTVPLQTQHPKEANYSSIDLSPYMANEKNRFGLFFVDVKGYDLDLKRDVNSAKDKRLILITDLGLVVKNNTNQTHDLFVLSISSGLPVAGASVELLGKNGVPVFSGKTDEQGRVSIPSTAGMSQEKTPTVYIVKSGKDLSFIPFDRHSRQINMSKFDIGGVRSTKYNQDSLNAFLFSDRGIYRPGEKINLGMVVKKFDFSNVEDIPLELVIRGPRNKTIKTAKFSLAHMGFNEYQYPTEVTADTGKYTVSLHLLKGASRSVIGSTSFKVEEFQPDTIKIESKLLDTVQQGWNTQESIIAKVSLNNLFGTPAQDRKMHARLHIQPHNFKFKAFSDYKFTDPYFDKNQKPLSLHTSLTDQRTNADGETEFELNLAKFKQGTYKLRFTAEGFDQAGGRSVVAVNSAFISPLDTLVGYKADGKLDYIKADSERAVEFIAIDKTLNKKSVQNLRLKIQEIQSISTLVKQRNSTYKYQTIKKEAEVSTQPLSLSSEGYVYAIDTKTPGDFVIEVFDEQDRRLSRVPFTVVGFANLSGKIDKNAELQVKLNKTDYKPGETIELNIKAPYHGAGLITIETDKVHNHKWFKTSIDSTVQHITIPEDIEGTGYVNVSFVRDISSKEIFTSPLSYAVAPFSIDKSKRRVDITLKTKDIVRPGKPMDIAFSTSRPARIAIFAVDEGILQVAKYQTPDPLAHFLKKRALGVNTLQILDLILPDFDLVKTLSASGGGYAQRAALAKNLNPFARKTERPAVYWSGIYDADLDLKNITFTVPDTFSGELRVMAVAVGEEAVGAASTASIVRGPFVISPNVLTQAAPGDEFDVVVGIANIIDGSGKGANIDFSVTASKHLEIISEAATILSIDEGSEGKFKIRVKVNNQLGAAELFFTAKHKEDELTRTASLSVRPASTYFTRIDSGFDQDGTVELTDLRTMYADLSQQSVAASASPLVIVDGLQRYLEKYPHGCTEQVVSKVFPLVGLMSHPAYGAHVKQVNEHFSHVIDKLRERQRANGGFAFWPSHSHAASYPSIYVMHFLLEARDLGYPVPADMMQRGKDYLKFYSAQQATSLSEARNRANALYLLTRMGVVTTNMLIDLQEYLLKTHKDQWQTDILAVYMGATYKLLHKNSEAKRLIRHYQLSAEHKDVNDFRSVLALDAQYIYLLAKHFKREANNLDGEQILKLTDRIFRGEYNTISSAYSILALGAYSELVLDDDFNENITFNGEYSQDKKQTFTAALAPFMKATYTRTPKVLGIQGDDSLFYLNVQSGFNTSLPTKAIREGIEIYRSFVDDAGNEVTSFEQGKELTVHLKIRALNGKSLSNIAVIDLLPGGFEVIRDSVARSNGSWRADHFDIREDRIVYYGGFGSSVRELTYKVKLTASGTFVIPPSYAESMYNRSIRAISMAGFFTVTPSL